MLTSGRTNDYSERKCRERTLMEEQMTLWKDNMPWGK